MSSLRKKRDVFQVRQGCYWRCSCSSQFSHFILGGRRRQKTTTLSVGGESCLRRMRKQDLAQFIICISNFRFRTLIYAFRLCNCKWMKLFFGILYLPNIFTNTLCCKYFSSWTTSYFKEKVNGSCKGITNSSLKLNLKKKR